jgi:hypothetical protein
MRAGCTVLEPYYKFRLEVPAENVGRAMSDLQARSAEFAMEEADGEFTALCGRAPVSALHGYAREVIAYTRGKGKLSCTSDGYEPCENGDEIAARFAYDPEADVENTPHSVFCAGGAGFIVPWQDVDEYKHIDADYVLAPEGQTVVPKPAVIAKKYRIDEDELEKIMLRLFGDGTPRKAAGKRVISAPKAEKPKKKAFAGIVGREKVSVEDMVEKVCKMLSKKRNLPFKSMFKRSDSKPEMIATFLALLEMIKLSKICADYDYEKKDFIITQKA